MTTLEIKYSPMAHTENLYMVLLIVENSVLNSRQFSPTYNVYVGNNTKRIFYNDTLPDFLKAKLAMVKCFANENRHKFLTSDTLYEINCYHSHSFIQNEEFKYIGWQTFDNIYVIVMTNVELIEIKGISIDPRKQSQEKS